MRYIKTFEKFNKVAFHGYLQEPEDMKLPECELDWTPGEQKGCPNFSDERKITKEDEKLAIEYLEQTIDTLIAYSRGGAILLQSVAKGAELPKNIYLVAPAWLRGWTTITLKGDEIKGANGVIIHGGKDDKVPLKHSAILSKMSGLPLYVFPECNHINILKHKDNVIGSSKVKNLDELIKALPDWGENNSTPEDVDKQHYISTLI